MTVGTLVIGVLLMGLWIVALSSFRLRNWRAMTLGVAGTVAIVIAGWLSWPVGALLQVILWIAVLWVFVLRSELVTAMSPTEYQFVEQYVNILKGVAKLKRRVRQTEPESYVSQFENAVKSLERLDAPDEWRQLQVDTAGELRRRLTRMKLSAMPSPDEQQAAEARWLEIERRFSQTLNTRAGFWKGWPHVSYRSRTRTTPRRRVPRGQRRRG